MLRRNLCMHTLLPILLLTTLALTSPPSLAQLDYEESPPSEYVAQIVTPVDRARVTIKKPRPRIHLSKTHQPIARLFLNDDDTDYYDELPDLQVGYRRPVLINQSVDIDLPDEIKIRLLLARKRALEAYHTNWG